MECNEVGGQFIGGITISQFGSGLERHYTRNQCVECW